MIKEVVDGLLERDQGAASRRPVAHLEASVDDLMRLFVGCEQGALLDVLLKRRIHGVGDVLAGVGLLAQDVDHALKADGQRLKVGLKAQRRQGLDATDRRLLSVLQQQGRISNADLSERVNLSPSACHRRVQRLEEEGFIRDYVALLDARKMGRTTVIYVEIKLSGQADEILDDERMVCCKRVAA